MKETFFVFLLLTLFETAQCCGGFFSFPQQPILQAGETIAFGVSPNEEGNQDVVMAVQINYSGPALDFSWILPVMVEPELSVGYDGLFTELFDSTRPIFRMNVEDNEICPFGDDWCSVTMNYGSVAREPSTSPPSAIVLQADNVGPYNTVVLQPAEDNPGQSVFNWLQENDYDQPEESFALIDYYARQGQLFVALRLRKDAEVGDIQPIVLKYTMPPDVRNVACVPIQLTSIAATADMPIQIYVLSDARAFPVNYLDVELDDTQADWVGCLNSPNCYINDMRARFANFLKEEGINDHAFVTEYAGNSSVVGTGSIALTVDVDALASTTSVPDFLATMVSANVPFNTLVNSIIERYIPSEYEASSPPSCGIVGTGVYSGTTSFCSQFLTTQTLDASVAAELTQELNTSIFQPAKEAQEFINRYTYLTRLYGQLSPDTMDKDPFFAFNSDLADVSNIHEASAVGVCWRPYTTPLEVNITVGGLTVRQPSSCGGWSGPGSAFFSTTNTSTATQAVAFGYKGEESRMLLRSPETGGFSPESVMEIVAFMDSRVVDQTVLPYEPTVVVSDGNSDEVAIGDTEDADDEASGSNEDSDADENIAIDLGDETSGSPSIIFGHIFALTCLIWAVSI